MTSFFAGLMRRVPRERIVLLIVAATVACTLVYAFAHRIRPAVDAQTYHTVAQNIVAGYGFRLDPTGPLEQDEAITYQGPLFQFVMAGMYALVGPHPEAVWIFHALLRGATVWLLYAVCVRVFGKEEGQPIGWATALLFGLSPDLVEISAMLMTETLFLFLSVLSVFLFVRAYPRPTIGNVAALTAAFGLTVLTRSTFGAFLLLFVFWLVRRKAWKELAVMVGLFAIIMTPWAVRNWRTYHQFLPTMANYGYNFWVGNRLGADGEGGLPAVTDAINQYGVMGANTYAVEQFKTYLFAHPFDYVRLTALRALKYLSPVRPMGFWFYQTGVPQLVFVASSVAWATILFTLAATGLWMWAMRERTRPLLGYLTVFTVLTAASVIPILVETRYRMPIYPFFAIAAGYAAVMLWKHWASARVFLLRGALVVAVIGVLDLMIEWRKVVEKLYGIFNA